MKHILFVLDYYLPHKGWSETVFEAIISRLLEKWYEISLCTSRFDTTLPKEEHKDQFHIYRIGKQRSSFMIGALYKGMQLLKHHKDIALIHTSTYGWAIPAALLGYRFHKRVIVTVHEIFGKLWLTYKWFWQWWLYYLFEKLIFCFHYDVYHCVSYYTMNALRLVYGIPDAKVKMIYNGVDTHFRNKDMVSPAEVRNRRTTHGRNDYFVVTYYGHAGKSKGLDYFVQALPELVTLDAKVLYVCNLIASKRTSMIKEKIRQYHLGPSVQIYDGLDKEDLRSMIASSDMIIAPSLSEGFGSVHTESTALQKPLLTTYVSSIPEVVCGNVRFVAPGSKREIIQAILERDKWIDNPEYVLPNKKFSRSATVKEIIKLYR